MRPWLFTILRHVIVDEIRSRAARALPTLPSQREGPPAGQADAFDLSLDAWLLDEALQRIRDDQRVVLVETYYRGRHYADVAAELGIPEGTARSRAFYGLRALRLALDELGWDG